MRIPASLIGKANLTSDRNYRRNKTRGVDKNPCPSLQALNVRQAGGHELIEQMHRPQNALMNEKAQRVILKEVPPILTPIIRDGIEQGLFDTPYPYECMELMIVYVNAIFDSDLIKLSGEEKANRLKAFLVHFERMLGAAEGSLAEAMVLLA